MSEPCSAPCNLCGGADVKTLATKSRSGAPLRTVICTRCGLVWTDPLPHNPREFYEKEYRLSYKGTFTPKPKHIFRAGRVALFRYSAIRNFLPKSGAVLDVGAGGGEFLHLLQKAGYRTKGIEPNIGYAEYSAREYGLDIANGFIQDADLPAASFDAITVWHVLEHTEDPFGVLSKLRDFLKAGGTIVVEVPNVEAVCQSPSSTFHEAHLFNFNSVTLPALAEKAGLSPVSVSTSPDGGNILLVCKKPVKPDGADETPPRSAFDPENAERILRIRAEHVASGHHFSLTPYLRFGRRLARIFVEWRSLSGYTNGKALLDAMYADAAARRKVPPA